jgi:type II secretory pathway pseudopilin PulG
MIQRISDWFHNLATGWATLAVMLVFALFMALVIPSMAASSEAQTGSQESPDTSFIYTAKDLYDMAQDYGDAGRQAYVRVRLTFDVIWPLVYCAFLVLAIGWLARRALPIGSRWQRANLVPLLAALFDYLENLFTSVVMLRYPEPTPILATLAPWMTMVKWLFVGASFGLLVVYAGIYAWRKVRDG